MTAYFICFFLSIVIGLLLNIGGWKKWKTYVYSIFTFILFSCLLGFRSGTGYDTYAYNRIYLDTAHSTIAELSTNYLEKGFLMFNKAFSLTSFDMGFGQWTVAVLSVFLLVLMIHHFCSNKWIAVATFIGSGTIFMALDYQRQFLAMAFSAFALIYIHRKDFFRFSILILLASTFHFSALILFPCYFFFRLPFNKIIMTFYVVVGTILVVFSKPIFNFLMYFVQMLRFGSSVGDFADFDITSSGEFAGGVPLEYMTLLIAITVVGAVFAKKLIARNKFNNTLLHCLAISTLFEAIGVKHAYISRFGLTAMPLAFMVILCELLEMVKPKIAIYSKNKQLAINIGIYGGIILSYIIMMYVMLRGNYNGCYPYMFII